MKGVIADCLHKMVVEKFGEDKWTEIINLSGLPPKSTFMVTQDYDDAKVMEVIQNTCKVLKISTVKAADAFGEYWVNSYANKLYSVYYKKFSTAKEFILGMDAVHDTTTKTIPNARPPRFEFKEIDPKTYLVTYKSERNMIDFYIGLVKGVGIYFNSRLIVQKVSESQVKIIFS